MNLNYAIFRSEPIYTLPDLAQIGSHNKREKKAYNSNPDIDLEKTKNNIELKPLTEKYVKGFYNITKEYKKEHDERMKSERSDRKKTFNQMLNSSKNVVADEMIFTATNEFFKDMKAKDIKRWADTCMDFVYKDLGYTKEQVLHATVHMDEATLHIHCVVVPLVKKLDKRTNTERYTISKKQYIHDKMHLSTLQDKYYERLKNAGFDLERGIKNSDREHIKIKEYKKLTRGLNKDLNNRHNRLNNVINEFNDSLKDSKNVLFDKEYVKVKKETFNSMNRVIKEVDNLMDVQNKVEGVFNEVEGQVKSYNSLKVDNGNLKNEIKYLKHENNKLEEENYNLKEYIKNIFEKIKTFFRHLLLKGNNDTKDKVVENVKDLYDKDKFDRNDVFDIGIATSKQDELFDYAHLPSYTIFKTRRESFEEDKSDDFEL